MSTFATFRLLCSLALLVLTCVPTKAYESDTHYAFTYFLARSTGYTPLQSLRIASADYGVDIDPVTEPHADPFKDFNNWENERYQRIRILFHAMLNQVNYPDCLKRGVEANLDKAIADLRQRNTDLLINCEKLGNVGPYLHFLQDYYSHAGYGSRLGHGDYKKVIHAPQISDVFPLGHDTDYIGHEPTARQLKTLGYLGYKWVGSRNETMAKATMDCLANFLQTKCRQQFQVTQRRPDNIKAVLQALAGLRAPSDTNSEDPLEAMDALARLMPDDFDKLRDLARIPYTYKIDSTGQTKYKYDITGVENMDAFVLWGNVTILLPQGCPSGTIVSLKLAPTRKNESPQNLNIPAERTGERSVQFKGCPIGSLLVCVSSPYGDTVDYTITLSRQRQTFVLPPLRLGIQRFMEKQPGHYLVIHMGAIGINNKSVPTLVPSVLSYGEWKPPASSGGTSALPDKSAFDPLMPQEQGPEEPTLPDLDIPWATATSLRPSDAGASEDTSGIPPTVPPQDYTDVVQKAFQPFKSQVEILQGAVEEYEAQAKTITVEVGGKAVQVQTVRVKPPFAHAHQVQRLEYWQQSLVQNRSLILGQLQTPAFQQAMTAHLEKLAVVEYETGILCKIPDEQMRALEGPIVVTFGKRHWEIGWINRYDISVSFEKGIPQPAYHVPKGNSASGSVPAQDIPFEPEAIQLQGTGTLTMRFLMGKPLSNGVTPEVAEDDLLIECTDGYKLPSEALIAEFMPGRFWAQGAIHTSASVTTAHVTRTYQRHPISATFQINAQASDGAVKHDSVISVASKSLLLIPGALAFGKFEYTTTANVRASTSTSTGGETTLSPRPGGKRLSLGDLYPGTLSQHKNLSELDPKNGGQGANVPGEELYIYGGWCPQPGFAFILSKDLTIQSAAYRIKARDPASVSRVDGKMPFAQENYPYPTALDTSCSYSYSLSWTAAQPKYR